MGLFFEDKNLKDRFYVFKNREDAGEKLAKFLKDIIEKDSIVLAVPSGGVPVGIKIAEKLNIPFDLILVKKLTYPWNPEAGFGAITVEGDTFINEKAVKEAGITENIINEQKEITINILKERDKKFRKNKPFPDVRNKTVIIVDDGLASGYTMLAAISMVKKRKPGKIIIAVPTCSKSSIEKIIDKADLVFCLNHRTGYPYAVADAYEEWYDLSDQDVLYYLRKEEKNA